MAGILASCSKETTNANYRTIPLPLEITATPGGGEFILDSSTKIIYPEGNEMMRRNAGYLAAQALNMPQHQARTTKPPATYSSASDLKQKSPRPTALKSPPKASSSQERARQEYSTDCRHCVNPCL